MVKYTLYYFDGRAAGETIRLIFAAADVPFEDIRFDPEKDWPAFKPKTPNGMLPVLEVDGEMLVESIAIARFVARETGLVGKTSLQQARLDSVVDILTEVRETAFPAYFTKDDTKKEELKAKLEEKMEKNFKLLENKLQHCKQSSFFDGDELSWADLHFLAVIDVVRRVLPEPLKSFQGLQELEKRVVAVPRVASYLKSRPDAKI